MQTEWERKDKKKKKKEARPPNTYMGSKHRRPLPYSFSTLLLTFHRHISSSLSSFFFFLSHLLFYLSCSLALLYFSVSLSLHHPPPSCLLRPPAHHSRFHSLLEISLSGRSSSLLVCLSALPLCPLFVSSALSLSLSLGLGARFCQPISSEVRNKRGQAAFSAMTRDGCHGAMVNGGRHDLPR